MKILKTIALIEKYSKCPECGNETIGNGSGSLIVDNNTFTRSCKCGYTITITIDGDK